MVTGTRPEIIKMTLVLIMRLSTERSEAGLARIIGTEKDKILSAINAALYDKQKLPTESPYGDGYAAKRIVEIIKIFLRLKI